jgi:hypothetical protein
MLPRMPSTLTASTLSNAQPRAKTKQQIPDSGAFYGHHSCGGCAAHLASGFSLTPQAISSILESLRGVAPGVCVYTPGLSR